MIRLETLRSERREEILRLADRRGARNLRVFGSVARGEATRYVRDRILREATPL